MKYSDTKTNVIKRIKYLLVKTLADKDYQMKQYLRVGSNFDELMDERDNHTDSGIYSLYHVESDEDPLILGYHDKLANTLANCPMDLKESMPKILVMFNEIKIAHRECIMNILDANKIDYDIDCDTYHNTLLQRAPHRAKKIDDFDVLLLCNMDGIVTEYMLDVMDSFIKIKKPILFLENNIIEYRG